MQKNKDSEQLLINSLCLWSSAVLLPCKYISDVFPLKVQLDLDNPREYCHGQHDRNCQKTRFKVQPERMLPTVMVIIIAIIIVIKGTIIYMIYIIIVRFKFHLKGYCRRSWSSSCRGSAESPSPNEEPGQQQQHNHHYEHYQYDYHHHQYHY